MATLKDPHEDLRLELTLEFWPALRDGGIATSTTRSSYMSETADIDLLINRLLRDFYDFILTAGWRGREREAVSLFSFNHLVPACEPGTVLYHPSQIGIEVSVPQVTELGKPQVAKDLVIWPEPHMTAWDDQRQPTRSPAVVAEWKCAGYPTPASGQGNRERDLKWLQLWTRVSEGVGYSIGLQFDRSGTTSLAADRVFRGEVAPDWLRLG